MTVAVMAAGEKQHLVFQSLPQDQSEAVISPQSHFTPVLIMNVWKKKKRSVLPIIISSQKREGDVLFDEEVHSKQQGNREKRKNRLVSPSAIL